LTDLGPWFDNWRRFIRRWIGWKFS